LVAACDDDDDAAALDTIRSARTLLQRLGESSGSLIETEALRNLCAIAESHGAAAKPSGAGGGDCGIALTREDYRTTEASLACWQAHGIRHLALVPPDGVGENDGF